MPSATRALQRNSRDRLRNVEILIVISGERAAKLIESMFRELGFDSIHLARDATEAVRMLKELQMHLIVTDVELKAHREGDNNEPMDLNGVQFVQRLRCSPSSPAPLTPVLMLLEKAVGIEVERARDAGVNELVVKPMQARHFCERIIQIIDQPRMHITALGYRGPYRRRRACTLPGETERRLREVRLVRHGEGVRS